MATQPTGCCRQLPSSWALGLVPWDETTHLSESWGAEWYPNGQWAEGPSDGLWKVTDVGEPLLWGIHYFEVSPPHASPPPLCSLPMTIDLQPYIHINVRTTTRLWTTEHAFEAGHQVDLSKATVIDSHPHPQIHGLLESWHIQHHQAPLNREQGPMLGLCIQPCLTDSFSPFTPPTPLYLTHFHIFIPAVLPVFIYASRNYPYLYTLHLKVSLSLMKTVAVFLKHLINPSSTWLVFLTKLLWLYQASQASTAKFMHLALFIHHFEQERCLHLYILCRS